MLEVAAFDTNVLLSGIGWRGKPYECLELVRAGNVAGMTCPEILDELSEQLQERLGFSPEQISDSLADLLSVLRLVRISSLVKAVPADPDDDKILECAVVGGATHIVTGDRRHLLPMGSFQGIPIVTPARFLELVSAG